MPHRDFSALRYDVTIDPAAETSHTRVLRMVGHGKRVLDLGCATGSLAAALREADCTVVGIEADPEAAALAKAHCEQVVVADLETDDLHRLDLGAPFDVIVAADVLEHLRDPGRLLRQLLGLFAPHGYLVTSIPNVAHGSVRLALLAGRFRYRDLGLLDHTHLRFFTRETMVELLTAGGFTPAYLERQQLAPTAGEVLDGVALESLPAPARAFVEADSEALVYQYVGLSFPGSPSGGLPAVIGGLAEQAEQLRELRADLDRRDREVRDQLEARGLELLAARDRVVREEVRAQLAERQAAALSAQLAELDGQRAVVENDLRDAHRRLEAIYASRLWQAGRVYRGVRRRLSSR